MIAQKERYIESLIEKINLYTKNSLCQIELKYDLKKSSEKVEMKDPNFPSIKDDMFIYKRARKISQNTDILNGEPITFRKYEVEINSIFGFKLKSFVVEIFQSESEEDLSVKEILAKIQDKSYSFEYFAKRYEEYVEYKSFDKKTGVVFYEQYFYIKKEDSNG